MELQLFKNILLEKLQISRKELAIFRRSKWVVQELESHTSFLPKKTSAGIRSWHIIHDVKEQPLCSYCKEKVPKFNANKWGYLDFCSVKCGRNSPLTQEKLEMTYRSLYGEGVINPYQAAIVKEKIRQTCESRYGVDCVFKDTQKMKLAILRKYGVDKFTKTPMFIEKVRKTSLERTGFLHPSQSPAIQKKMRETWMRNFGVDHPMRDPTTLQKVLEKVHSFREVELPSGRKTKLQGYEPEVLLQLLNEYPENDILFGKSEIAKRLGKITYVDFQGKERTYFPDFYIISENKVIEVKSSWTYDKCGKVPVDRNINHLKRDACLSLGLNFEFRIPR